MELDFTVDQEELQATVRTVLATECTPAVVRELVEARTAGKPVNADALWSHMVELGWPALTVPEAHGGLGLGAVELALVVEELGRALAPGPLLPTISQFVPALAALGSEEQQDRFLAPVAAGSATGTLALAEATGSFDPAAVATTATPGAGGSYRLEGVKHGVLEAEIATDVVVVARTPGTTGDDGIAAFVVALDALDVVPIAALDQSRVLATVSLADVDIPSDRVLGAPGPSTAAALRRVVQEATVALALESVGTAQQAFDISVAYAKEREQFGAPIGSFQATKHKLADMLLLVERARALGYFAALTIAEADARAAISTSMAKAAAGDAAQRIAREGIQIHGGIGYTWEHDMHLYVRRLQSSSALFGGPNHHRQLIADLLGL
ncbi:MAG TPA: acyl-CoA dehydrogenase family protein [Acidimicrobiia bacterium]